jgi:hypothetical protein
MKRKSVRPYRAHLAAIAVLTFFVWGKIEAAEKPSVPERILLDLRAANDARTALEKERAEWQAEKARLELLEKLLKEEVERRRTETERAESGIAKIRQESAGMNSTVDEHRQLETAATEVSDRLHEALDARASASLPGVVPVGQEDSTSRKLDVAMKRLADTEAACRMWSVEVASGFLNGEELAVRLLRAGDAGAWWMALDGLRAGTARMEGGRLLLEEIRETGLRDRILSAFSMQAGRMVADWLVLPLAAGTKPKAAVKK